jgi:prepilin peptidase CpaA
MLFYITFSIITVWLVVLGWYDCCYRRLPNWLTLGGAAVFLAYRFALGGIGGVTGGLIGGLIGGAFLLIPFLMRGAGAGDIQMFFAVGCLAGYPAIFSTMVLATVFGLILGTVMLIAGRADGARLRHWFRCCWNMNYDRKEGRKLLPEKNNEAVRIPFGVAIAAGAWTGLLLSVLAK